MKKLLIITMVVTALLSCTQDEDLNPVDQGITPNNQEVALSVKAGIMVGPSVMTKSIIIGDTLATDAAIGVQVLKGGAVYQTELSRISSIPEQQTAHGAQEHHFI